MPGHKLIATILFLPAMVWFSACGGSHSKVDKNTHDSIVSLREEGKRFRNESRFDEALKRHGEGLHLAEQAGDTLEWVQALNNVGTDYRRMGVLDAALQYHESALRMAEECADTSFIARKNRVVSLNGLANVYMTIGNYEKADSTLRLALEGERRLNSLTGQAINYANLGSIFETRGQTDSAWVCYRKSMELNRRDSNELGIALCHTSFGKLYEEARQYDKALEEYNAAYEIMKKSKDDWHTLNSLTALAGIYIGKGDAAKASGYLDESMAIAKRINSHEHLAEIYTLLYKMKMRQGDFHGALASYERATAMKDSVIDMEKVNRMQSISFNIERGQQLRRMTVANDKLRSERSIRHSGYIVFAIILVLLIGIIGLLIHTRRLRARSHAELKRLNAVRESFFTNITHEFRTPLTVILGLSHDLRQGGTTTAEAQDMGATIERQGNRMLHLINQLLDISKIRSAIGTPDWKRGNIVAYIGMIVETFEDYSRKRGVRLQFFANDNDIETDFVPDYISKIVNNLLSNALKFSPESGRINVSVGRKNERVLIDIADTGRGIPADSLPHIFEAFYQSNNIDEGSGTGVGLALVSQIVKTLGGTITVDSTLGKGSVFHIALPIKEGMAKENYEGEIVNDTEPYTEGVEEQTSDTKATPSHPTQENSILVVEDNKDVAAFIGKRLEGAYSVIYASNGEEGLAIAKEKLPDAIVTDLMMPRMDGLELTEKIRADMLTCHIPVVVVTAKVTEKDRIRGLEAGADAYLVKPFNSDELITRVGKLLEQRRMLRQKFSQAYLASVPDTQAKPAAADNSQASPNQLDTEFINRITDSIYLLINANKPVDVNAVADRMNMSYSQLYRKLSALTNMTPVQYIMRIKVSKAKLMLSRHPETSLYIVAERCGFSDYSNFVRAFKNVMQLTPTQYVRNIMQSD